MASMRFVKTLNRGKPRFSRFSLRIFAICPAIHRNLRVCDLKFEALRLLPTEKRETRLCFAEPGHSVQSLSKMAALP